MQLTLGLDLDRGGVYRCAGQRSHSRPSPKHEYLQADI
jgi:hypothetical protein